MMGRSFQQKLWLYTHEGIYRKKISELEDTEVKVVWLLKHYPHLRECDKCLIKYFHVKNDLWYGELTEGKIHGLTTEETITRSRRHIQNEFGLFLPDNPEVVERRKIAADAVRTWAVENKKMQGWGNSGFD